MKLSNRVRPNSEAAPWVVKEIEKLESQIDELTTLNKTKKNLLNVEWVGLNDDERRDIREWQEIQKHIGPIWAPMMLYLYLAIEKKLKEKNQF
jgi:hypothetical protein